MIMINQKDRDELYEKVELLKQQILQKYIVQSGLLKQDGSIWYEWHDFSRMQEGFTGLETFLYKEIGELLYINHYLINAVDELNERIDTLENPEYDD